MPRAAMTAITPPRVNLAVSGGAAQPITAAVPASTIAMRMFTGEDYDRAMIGIPLLTLVPGELGGSETYVRELLRGLGRVGEHEYEVLLPPAAPTAAEGLPSEIATEYRLAH